MKNLFKHIKNQLTVDEQVNFTEEDPTYGETFQYFGEMIRTHWIFILGFGILYIIAKSL